KGGSNGGISAAGVFRARSDVWRQVAGLDDVAFTQSRGALDSVFQLANIAGPIIGRKKLHRLPGQLEGLAGAAVGFSFQEVSNEQRNVFATIAQAGQLNLDDIEAIV